MSEFDKTLEAYEQAFDDSFPMSAMACTSPDEIVSIISKCISENKDVYDMGYLSIDGTY